MAMVEKLLIPFSDEVTEHKQAQLAELAQLNGKDAGKNLCKVCGEDGQEQHICPSTLSTPVSCETDGASTHPRASVAAEAFPPVSNSLPGPPGHGLGSTPIAQIKPEANLTWAKLEASN